MQPMTIYPDGFSWYALGAVLRCAKAGVAVYSPHTACDNCAIGVNDWLAEAFATDPSQVAPIEPTKFPEFPGAGSGRIITLPHPLSLQEAVDKTKAHLALSHVRISVAELHLPVLGDLAVKIARVAPLSSNTPPMKFH